MEPCTVTLSAAEPETSGVDGLEEDGLEDDGPEGDGLGRKAEASATN
jgi:hypothetical protein